MSETNPNDEFFVGYLPVPARTGRFIACAAVVVATLLVLIAVCVGGFQRDPGNAVWDLSQQTEFEGILRTQPYPVLQVSGPGGQNKTVLLVGDGKHGADQLVDGLDGRSVRATGHLLNRPIRSMLELDAKPSPLPGSSIAAPGVLRGRVTLRGEIVDSKCFLGAMKPGDGKTHKACASLCIRGGVPPLMVTVDDRGALTDYLVAVDSIDQLLPYVGDYVEVTGELEIRGDLRILRISSPSSDSGGLQISRIAP